MTSPDTPAPTISQDVPAPAAVTAEMVRKAWLSATHNDTAAEEMAAHLNEAIRALKEPS